MEFTERFLYHIWDAQHLSSELRTKAGNVLKIAYPGRWNTDSGPDFKDAIIEVNGQAVRGDVEVDKTNFEWRNHGHYDNPQFNSVVLHVVYQHHGMQPCTIREDGNEIEVLELQHQLDNDITKLLQRYGGVPFVETDKFCRFFTGFSREETAERLEQLAMERLESKRRRFAAELRFADYDQLSYEGIMEAMGYSKNKFQMLRLSQVCPYALIKDSFADEQDSTALLCYLVGVSGLTAHIPNSLVLNTAKLPEKKEDIQWKLFRIRPGNHPVIRLSQIAVLLQESFSDSLFNRLVRLFSFTKEEFSVQQFTQRCYSFFGKPAHSVSREYILGSTRVDTIIINILLPLMLQYARAEGYESLEESVITIYRNMKRLPDNHIVHSMEQYMDDGQKRLVRSRAMYQQGLLRLYDDYCRDHNCRGCLAHFSVD